MSPCPKEIPVIKICMKDIWARELNSSISLSQTLGRHCLLHEIREPDSSLVLALVPHSASPQVILCPTWGQCHQYWACVFLMQQAMCWGEEQFISPKLLTPYILLLFLTTRTNTFISVKCVGGTVMNQNQSHKTLHRMNKKMARVCVLSGDLGSYRQKLYMPEKEKQS